MLFVRQNPFFYKAGKEKTMKKTEAGKPVIAFRKSCKTVGTGLSHYILIEKKKKQ